METYLPFCHRKPNTFIRYEERRFEDGFGNVGNEIVAIYKDKNGNIKEESAQVRFDKT